MSISLIEKNEIFSFVERYFSWCSKDIQFFDIYNGFSKHNLFEKDFSYDSGAAKVCIFHPFFGDYVVKFCYEDFDYCEREYTNYLAAVENGLEEFFAFTDYLGIINGLRFYIQERCDCDAEAVSSIVYNSVKEDYVNENNESEDVVSERIWDVVYDLDDEAYVTYCFGFNEELIDFLGEYAINDLHEGNFGYVDGQLVIIDFSGYGFIATNRPF